MKAQETLHLQAQKSQAGNAVLGVLAVIVGIGITLNIVVTQSASQSSFVLQNARLKWSRGSIAYQIERSASLPATFRTSLRFANNSALRNCILGTGPAACRGDGTEYPLDLYTSNADAASGAAANAALQISAASVPEGSNSTVSVLYDSKGQRCQNQTTATRECPFEVSTSFTAECAAAAATCATADSIRVLYTIRIPESVNSNGGVYKGQTVLAELQRLASKVQTSSIYPPANNYVPNAINSTALIAGDATSGFDINGNAISTSKKTPLTEDEVMEEVLRIVGRANTVLAWDITENIIWSKSMSDRASVREIAEIWSINPAVGKGVVNRTHSLFLDDHATDEEVSNYIKSARQANIWIEDPHIAYEMAQEGVTSVDQAHAIYDAIVSTGTSHKPSITAIIDGHITDPTMAAAVATVVAQSGMTEGYQLAAFANAAMWNKNSSVPALQNLAQMIIGANTGEWGVAFEVLEQGITDLEVVREMHRKKMDERLAKAAAAAPPVATPAAPAVAPVSMAATCTKVSDCANSVGM